MDGLANQISRYEILKPLAEGGFGQVYLARVLGEAGFHRTVAIKRIKPELTASPEFVTDFIKEARIGGYLQHHNVVQVLGFERIGGQYALVMEYVDGVGLERVLTLHRVQSLPIDRGIVAEFMAQAAEGLHYVHTLKGPDKVPLKLVHRDLKPSNLLVSEAGMVKISDFGIARAAVQLGQQKTQAGLIKGTVAYFSPEQARGEEMDGRSDLYTMGSILYEMLALEPLFRNPQPYAVLGAVGRNDVDEKLAALEAEDGAFLPVLRRLLTSSPDERYENAAQLAADLRRLQYELAQGGQSLQSTAGVWVETIRQAQSDGDTAEPTALMATSHGDPWLDSMQLGAPTGYGDAPTLADPNLLQGNVMGENLSGPTEALRVPLPKEATPPAMRQAAAALPETQVHRAAAPTADAPLTSAPSATAQASSSSSSKMPLIAAAIFLLAVFGVGAYVFTPNPMAEEPLTMHPDSSGKRADSASQNGAQTQEKAHSEGPQPQVGSEAGNGAKDAPKTGVNLAGAENGAGENPSDGANGQGAKTTPAAKSDAQSTPKKPKTTKKTSAKKSSVKKNRSPSPSKSQPKSGTQTKNKAAVKAETVAKANPGFASVTSLPAARVFVDGKDRGETPLRKLKLSAGKHKLRLSRPDLGYQQTLDVDVKSEKEVRVLCREGGCDVTYP